MHGRLFTKAKEERDAHIKETETYMIHLFFSLSRTTFYFFKRMQLWNNCSQLKLFSASSTYLFFSLLEASLVAFSQCLIWMSLRTIFCNTVGKKLPHRWTKRIFLSCHFAATRNVKKILSVIARARILVRSSTFFLPFDMHQSILMF